MPLVTQIWEIGKRVTLELLQGNTEIMQHLERLAENLENKSFGERIAKALKQQS